MRLAALLISWVAAFAYAQAPPASLDDLAEKDRAARERLSDVEADLAELKTSLANTDERLKVAGMSGPVAQLLLEERRRLSAGKAWIDTLGEVQTELTATRLERISVRELRQATRDRVTRAGLVEREQALDRHIKLLGTLESRLSELIAQRGTLKTLLDERLLWTPSDPPIDAAWITALPRAMVAFVSDSRWPQTAARALKAFAAHPLWALLLLALVGAAFALVRHAKRALEPLASAALAIDQATLKPSWAALGWSLIGALKWPLVLLALALALQASGADGRFSDSLGRALQTVAWAYFLFSASAWLLRDRGLAHAHFRWSRPRREALRGALPYALLLTLPALLLATLDLNRDLGTGAEPTARALLIVSALGWAALVWWVLRAQGLFIVRGVAGETRPMLRKALRVGGTAAALAIAALSYAGYHLSALELAQRLLLTLLVLAALTVLHGLALRWLKLSERRLARRPRAAESSDTGELALQTIGEQTRRLLRAATLSVGALALFGVWADLLPALKVLDELTLWRSGEATISAKAVGLALLVFALLLVALKNLNGVFELALNRVTLDAGARYAALNIVRYALVVIGVTFGLSLLGVRWSHLQWLAAAFTVGLGFGLQEIFANFVSGLIVLLERPFRVGDVITVGTYTGTVSKIRTRATTLIDWDNKEIIIPNKTFITGQLTNWTLSDTVTRLAFKLQVDADSDPTAVHALLRSIASADPRVLKTPPPSSWLSKISDGVLEFDWYCFVGALRDRQPALNALNEGLSLAVREGRLALATPPTPPTA